MTMNRPPIAGLQRHLGFWLRFVSNHVSASFARKLEAQGVTVAEWVLLRELYDVIGLAPSDLASRVGLTRGAVSKLADRLLTKALISRVADPHDGRAQILSLTPAGIGLVPALAQLADQNETEFFDHLTETERGQLEATLRDIVARRGLTSIPVD